MTPGRIDPEKNLFPRALFEATSSSTYCCTTVGRSYMRITHNDVILLFHQTLYRAVALCLLFRSNAVMDVIVTT